MPNDDTTHKLIAALEGYERLIGKAQAVLAGYLEPGSGLDAVHVVEGLLGILDGLRERVVYDAARKAIAEARQKT